MKTKFSIVVLFFILNICAVAQDIKILSSDASSIVVEYIPVYSDTISTNVKSGTYISFVLPYTSVFNIDKKGDPQILVRALNIGVPSEFGNTIQILSQEYSTIKGKYLPVPVLVKDSVSNTESYSESSDYYSSSYRETVDFGEFGMMRSLRVQRINIYPVQFDGASNTIRNLKRVVFRINYSKVNLPAAAKINESFYESFILNWQAAQNWGAVQNTLKKTNASLFASGDWYRFETPEEGIYKIDRTFLQNLGINVSSVDPKTIKIFGNGGYSLPENISLSNNQGLIENSIYVYGETDGSFDAGDYILFYGRPPEFWEYSSTSKKIIRIKQPYTKTNYYWLTFGNGTGKRMEEKPSLNNTNAYIQTTTFAFKSYDKDSVNIGKGGRDYFCDPLNTTLKSRTYINLLTGIVPGSTINYNTRVINSSTVNINYRIDESGNQIYTSNIYGNGDYVFGVQSRTSVNIPNNLSQERSVLKFVLNSGAIDAEMYMDFFEITYQKYLNAVGDNLFFYSKDTSAVISYTLNNFSNSSIRVFDVTNFSNVKVITNPVVSGGQLSFQSIEKKDNVSKYFALTDAQLKTPANAGKITAVDLRGNISGSEMIVITSKEFKTQAESYVNYRSNLSPNKLSTSVYYVDDILNDFSGGLMDPTAIRDFLKYAYENWQTKPMYVLLFGDGSYDFLNTVKNNINIVPTYQTNNGLSESSSAPMDDFFSRIVGNDSVADIAIGRLCIQSIDEAESAVKKIIDYETNEDKSEWRNRITLVADDAISGQGSLPEPVHTRQSENLASNIIPDYMDETKIYLVAYPTEYVGAGRRKPEVNKAIINAINGGTLILNYVGHGAPKFWAHEYVFETAVAIPQMTNKNYFLLTAATCDFGLYDDPSSQSGAEDLVNQPGVGAILAFTAARIVESGANDELNRQFYSNIFNVHLVGGTYDRIGMAYLLTKQIRNNSNDEKFHLFGDPALRLNLPRLPVSIDSLNGKGTNIESQLKALGTVKIQGSIKNDNGNINPVNGEAIISVFDSKREQYFEELKGSVSLQGGLIFRGRVTVTNGLFSTEFVVPKDISYENKQGKIVVYFYNDNTDGVGLINNFTVGGTDTSVVNDGKGPEIEIFFDNENFPDAYLVNPNFTLIAKLNDQRGINTTGTGIGHKLEGILNDDLSNTIDFTNYFVGDLNSGGKSGNIKYPFTSMETGDYKIKIKAWDVFNNFSSKESYFSVVSTGGGLAIRDVYNYPNPFADNTTFTFQHNIGVAINVKIKIYTIAGRLIKVIEQNDILNKFVRIDWDGRDEDGNNLANGTYLYKMIVESVDGDSKDTVLGKLAVIK